MNKNTVPNLEEFAVADDTLLRCAISFQIHKQLCLDNAEYLTNLFAKEQPNTPRDQIAKEIQETSTKVFDPGDTEPYQRDIREPAQVVFFDRGLPRKDEGGRSIFPNSRPYYLGISINRKMSGPQFMKWVNREFIPFIKSSMKYAARVDLSGGIEFSIKDQMLMQKVGGAAISHHDLEIRHCTKQQAASENISNKKMRWLPSTKHMRSHLLSIACYRYKQAGFDYIRYNDAQKHIPLETYQKRSSEPIPIDITEEAFNARLRIATQLMRDQWKLLQVDDPENTPGIHFELGKRFPKTSCDYTMYY